MRVPINHVMYLENRVVREPCKQRTACTLEYSSFIKLETPKSMPLYWGFNFFITKAHVSRISKNIFCPILTNFSYVLVYWIKAKIFWYFLRKFRIFFIYQAWNPKIDATFSRIQLFHHQSARVWHLYWAFIPWFTLSINQFLNNKTYYLFRKLNWSDRDMQQWTSHCGFLVLVNTQKILTEISFEIKKMVKIYAILINFKSHLPFRVTS